MNVYELYDDLSLNKLLTCLNNKGWRDGESGEGGG